MNATMTMHEVVCSQCGDALGEFSDEERSRVGRCCENLPAPWGFDENTNSFTRSLPPEIAERYHRGDDVDLDEEDARTIPTCSLCGSHIFIISVSQWRRERGSIRVDASDSEDETLYYSQHDSEWDEGTDDTTEDFEIRNVMCESCSQSYHGNTEAV